MQQSIKFQGFILKIFQTYNHNIKPLGLAFNKNLYWVEEFRICGN